MTAPQSVTDSFKNWALDASKKAALRWEDPNADEMPVVYAQDVYGDLHVLPVPPIYAARLHGHLAWLAQTLPSEVRNRSLVRLAFRASVWAAPDTTYKDFSEDPRRQELLMVTVVEGKRAEAWGAPITRTASGLPKLAEWEQFADEVEGSGGPVHDYLHQALKEPVGKNGRTMPAANMVLGPYDVPADFFPDWRGEVCGPLNFLREVSQSSYRVLFRPQRPDA